MAYDPREWKDGASGDTPITAAALNHMEQGIADKAERGPKGATGAKGADGASVTGASSDGVTITFELSNGDTIDVPWPSSGGA